MSDVFEDLTPEEEMLFFGPDELVDEWIYRPDIKPEEYLAALIESNHSLFIKAVLLRRLRDTLMRENSKTAHDLRGIEASQNWGQCYVLPPAIDEDPLGLREMADPAKQDAIITHYVIDALQRAEYGMEPAEPILYHLAKFYSNSNEMIGKWQDDFDKNQDAQSALLNNYRQSLLYANVFSDIEADFVGMDMVKETLWGLYQAQAFGRMSTVEGFEDAYLSMHIALVANRGKGKSTIVPYIGKAMKRLGLLEKGDVVNITLNSIAESTLGAEEKKIQQAFDNAADGIVFVDEADTFAGFLGKSMTRSRVVQALNSLAEERRSNTCLIIATYPENIDILLDSDQALRSRFGPRILYLPEFTTTDLVVSYERNMRKLEFRIENDAVRSELWNYLSDIRKTNHKSFANMRTVREITQTTMTYLGAQNKFYQDKSDKIIRLQDIRTVISLFKNAGKKPEYDVYAEENPFNKAALNIPSALPPEKIVTLDFGKANKPTTSGPA